MTDRAWDVIVIGATLEGLAAAGYLVKAGLRTLVLDDASEPGGEARTMEIAPGFRIDAASHDDLISPFLARDLNLSRHGLAFVRPNPAMAALSHDAPPLLMWRDQDRAIEAIRQLSARDAERWPSFAAQMHRFSVFLEHLYRAPPPQPITSSTRDMLALAPHAWRLRRLGKEDMVTLMRALPMSVAELLDDWFESDLLKGTLGALGVNHFTQGPRSGGTAFLLLHHMVGAEPGLPRPRGLLRGGPAAAARALTQSVTEAGGSLRHTTTVKAILAVDDRVTGVATESGDTIHSRIIVSAASPQHTFLTLVDPVLLDPEFLGAVRTIRSRGAWAKVNLAVDALPQFTGLGNGGEHGFRGLISIGPSLDYLERAYDDAKYGRMSQRPHLTVTIPSIADPGLAPAGKHVVSITMQYAPYDLRGDSWEDAARDRLGDHVLGTLAEFAPELRDSVVARQVLTPKDLENGFGSPEGNLYHTEMALDQILFMRPVPGWADYRTPIGGLYLCGPATHPGGGLVGYSARNVARTILRDLKTR